MRINLLHKDYTKIETLFEDFVNNQIETKPIYSSFDDVEVSHTKPFEIYFGNNTNNKKSKFIESLMIVKDYYNQVDREYVYDQRFWNTLFLKHNAKYFLDIYPEINKNQDLFYKTIFLKKFNWENYVYKLVIAVDFIENNSDFEEEKSKFYEMVYDNLDLFNYLIKYPIFRSGDFLVKIFRIIIKQDIQKELKRKLHHLPGDQRLGRMIIFELNKIYPVVMVPLMPFEELEERFMDIFNNYISEENRYLLNKSNEGESYVTNN